MSVFLQKAPALQAGDLAVGLARELARVREEPQDLALVCRGGEQVHVSRRLLALWSPLVRATVLEASSLLLPDFPSTAVHRLTSLLLPGWEEEVVTREEVEVLQALAITFTNMHEGEEEQQHLADTPPQTAPEVEIKEEPDEPDDAVEVNPFLNEDSPDFPSTRKEKIEQLKARISKIEKISEKKRTTAQKASLLLFLDEYLQANGGQPPKDVTKHRTSKKVDSMDENKSITIKSKNEVFGVSKKTRKQLEVTQNTQTKDTENEKPELVPKDDIKPLMVLIDCDQCKMKFLNEKSLMMHKRTEHRSSLEGTEAVIDCTVTADLQDLDDKISTMMEDTEKKVFSGNQNRKIYICKVCGKEADVTNIRMHIESKHITGISHTCDICGKAVRSRKALGVHKSTCHKSNLLV